MKTNIHFLSYLIQFLEFEMFQTKVVEILETHILCSIIFFPESRAVYEILWKNVVQHDKPDHNIIRCIRPAWLDD